MGALGVDLSATSETGVVGADVSEGPSALGVNTTKVSDASARRGVATARWFGVTLVI